MTGERAEVVIVGAGFAGAATAYFLARAGVRVVVVERETTLGRHASGRNAALCRQLADEPEVTALSIEGARMLASPPPGLPRHLLRPTGSLLVARDDARLDRLAAAATRADLAHRRCGPAEVLAAWPRLAGLPMAGALAVPGDGVIDIHALLGGLIDGARAAGAIVEFGSTVRGAARRGKGALAVATDHGELAASIVVVAAGAWAGALGAALGGGRPDLALELRHLFVSEPAPDVAPDAPFAWYEDDGDEFYVRPERGGVLLSACDRIEATPCDAAVAPDARAALAARLARVAPRLAELPIADARACIRSFVEGRRPLLGWDAAAPGLYWVAALGGHGATTSLAIGARAAAAIKRRLRG